MFIERYIRHFEKLVLFTSFLAGIFAIIFVIIKGKKFNIYYLYIIIPILLSAIIYSVFIGRVTNYLIQFIIIFSSLFPLILIDEIENDKLIFIAKIIFVLAFIQVFFDLLLPNPDYSDLDKYTGTFNSGNDKARFLLFVLLFFYFLGNKVFKIKPFGYFFRFLYAVPIMLSIFIGFSMFAYINFIIAVISGYLIKKLLPFIVLNIVGFTLVIAFIYNADFDIKSSGLIKYNYHRYFDLEHGVAAVYNYGWEILASNEYIFGVGFGNWVSRSSQLFKSDYLKDNPSTMISFGTLYTESAAPPGLSAFYIQVIELGIISIPLLLLFLQFLFKMGSSTRYGLISFYFLFYFINYSPLFFEFQSLSYLFLSSYLVFNKINLSK